MTRSKSDAMAVIFAADGPKQKNWAEVGRTDTVANSLGGWERGWAGSLLGSPATVRGLTRLHNLYV